MSPTKRGAGFDAATLARGRLLLNVTYFAAWKSDRVPARIDARAE